MSNPNPTNKPHPRDARSLAIADLHTLEATRKLYDEYAKSAPPYRQAAIRRAAGNPIVRHRRALLDRACFDQQVAEQIAGRHRHGNRFGHFAVLTITLTGFAETAMAYYGLTLAVPSLTQAGGSSILSFIAQQGALLAAVGIGVISTAVTAAVGRQLSLAHRGLIQDPPGRSIRQEPAR